MNAPLSSLSRDPIAVLMPDCRDPAEREARRRLMIARDLASAKLPHMPPGHAQTLLWLVVETATASAFAPAPLEELEAALRYCTRLLLCARWAESKEQPFDEEE